MGVLLYEYIISKNACLLKSFENLGEGVLLYEVYCFSICMPD
jgi:hypothetical protein